MMKTIVNKLNNYRESSLWDNFYDTLMKSVYKFCNTLGYLRGILTALRGKIKYDGIYRPLILGAKTEMRVRPGSSIILKGKKNEEFLKAFCNNPVFPSATTIGLRPHYDALDPPAYATTRIELLNGACLKMEINTIVLSGCYITGSHGADILIGENSYISQEVIINSRCLVSIGKNVMLGHRTRIMDYDAHKIGDIEDINKPMFTSKQAPIVIGDNVWTGFGVTILKGVSIGRGSIIGANACVVSDIPENSIAVGNPARVVRGNVTWRR
jgi:acetyltransferase-like isoleucine patch superfamily enzyme